MNKGYNEVEISEEEVQALENPEESTVSQPAIEADEKVDNISTEESNEVEAPIIKDEVETETTVEPAKAGEDDFDGLDIDGNQISREQILAWREDSDNKENWQKSNTEKAQNLSKWNKLSEKINKDESFRSHLKDYFFDDPEAIKSLGLDGDIDIPKTETKEEVVAPVASPEVEQRLKMLEDIEGDRLMETRVDQLDEQLTNLEDKFPEYLEGEKVAEFLEYADKNATKFVDDGMPNLERAFREWSYGEMQAELDHFKKLDKNGKRNEGKIIGTAQVGAKEVTTPKKLSNNWKQITMEDPEIAKYFDD